MNNVRIMAIGVGAVLVVPVGYACLNLLCQFVLHGVAGVCISLSW